MRKINVAILVGLITTSVVSLAEEAKKTDKPEFVWNCQADREFITTYEYLKAKKTSALNLMT